MKNQVSDNILPVGMLMKEHRVIERMINIIAGKVSQIEINGEPDFDFISKTGDFFRFYADRCHHGKEEDILFKELSLKKISDEHKRVMGVLINDHRLARIMVQSLIRAGEEKDKAGVLKSLKDLLSLYPRHIETEDEKFFLPVMEYFKRSELDRLIGEFADFDRKVIHEKYKSVLNELESSQG